MEEWKSVLTPLGALSATSGGEQKKQELCADNLDTHQKVITMDY